MFKLQRKRIQNTQFAFYISDTPVTLKQSQGHQTQIDNVNLSTKFERFHFNGVWEKANIKVFSKGGNMSIISYEHLQKWKIVTHLWFTSCDQ